MARGVRGAGDDTIAGAGPGAVAAAGPGAGVARPSAAADGRGRSAGVFRRAVAPGAARPGHRVRRYSAGASPADERAGRRAAVARAGRGPRIPVELIPVPLRRLPMLRALPVCAALGVLLLLFGRTDGGGEPTETVVRLAVPPAAEPQPALRYQLLPELAEMEPGNAVQGYMKAFAEQHNLFANKDTREQQEKWLSMPLKDLPLKEVRDYGGNALRQADYAARLENADWQMLIPLRREGLHLLIPDVAQMRTLSLVLRVRLRAEIAERRFEDAAATVKTLLAMARHLGEAPTLIADLVGVAVAVTTCDALGEMIEQPGSPNLYWALTNL